MRNIPPNERILFPFDRKKFTVADAELIQAIAPYIGGVKIGLNAMSAFDADGVSTAYKVYRFVRTNLPHLKIMWDGKFKDIPQTVGDAVANIASLNVWGMTMFPDGGRESIKAAVANRGSALIMCVTVLTSIDDDECEKIYGRISRPEVASLSAKSKKHGGHAIVSSPLELDVVRIEVGMDLLTINPGIRDDHAPPDDQERTMCIEDAIRAGCDHPVIGRPISRAEHPIAATINLVDRIATAEANLSMV
jgi:orotidine-5'-phosphate decarboxylase